MNGNTIDSLRYIRMLQRAEPSSNAEQDQLEDASTSSIGTRKRYDDMMPGGASGTTARQGEDLIDDQVGHAAAVLCSSLLHGRKATTYNRESSTTCAKPRNQSTNEMIVKDSLDTIPFDTLVDSYKDFYMNTTNPYDRKMIIEFVSQSAQARGKSLRIDPSNSCAWSFVDQHKQQLSSTIHKPHGLSYTQNEGAQLHHKAMNDKTFEKNKADLRPNDSGMVAIQKDQNHQDRRSYHFQQETQPKRRIGERNHSHELQACRGQAQELSLLSTLKKTEHDSMGDDIKSSYKDTNTNISFESDAKREVNELHTRFPTDNENATSKVVSISNHDFILKMHRLDNFNELGSNENHKHDKNVKKRKSPKSRITTFPIEPGQKLAASNLLQKMGEQKSSNQSSPTLDTRQRQPSNTGLSQMQAFNHYTGLSSQKLEEAITYSSQIQALQLRQHQLLLALHRTQIQKEEVEENFHRLFSEQS